jgi:hypothetical protein
MSYQMAIIRAMPAQGHSRRWCAQRPWSKALTEVKVVEMPNPKATAPMEISVKDLIELQADPHIAVQLAGTSGSLELNTAKAQLLELEKQLVDVRREAQGEVEDLKAKISQDERRSTELGAKAETLQAEIARLTAEQAATDTDTKRRK